MKIHIEILVKIEMAKILTVAKFSTDVDFYGILWAMNNVNHLVKAKNVFSWKTTIYPQTQ